MAFLSKRFLFQGAPLHLMHKNAGSRFCLSKHHVSCLYQHRGVPANVLLIYGDCRRKKNKIAQFLELKVQYTAHVCAWLGCVSGEYFQSLPMCRWLWFLNLFNHVGLEGCSPCSKHSTSSRSSNRIRPAENLGTKVCRGREIWLWRQGDRGARMATKTTDTLEDSGITPR